MSDATLNRVLVSELSKTIQAHNRMTGILIRLREQVHALPEDEYVLTEEQYVGIKHYMLKAFEAGLVLPKIVDAYAIAGLEIGLLLESEE